MTDREGFCSCGEGLGDGAVEIIDSVSRGVQGTVAGYAQAKENAIAGIVWAAALGGALIILAASTARR